MNRRFLTFRVIAVLACGIPSRLLADPVVVDEATRKRIDQKAGRLVEAIKLTDADKAAKVKAIASDWLAVMLNHKRHKVKVEQYVGTLEWSKLHKAFGERGKAKAEEKKGDAQKDAAAK